MLLYLLTQIIEKIRKPDGRIRVRRAVVQISVVRTSLRAEPAAATDNRAGRAIQVSITETSFLRVMLH
jgi:hypothetical protein